VCVTLWCKHFAGKCATTILRKSKTERAAQQTEAPPDRERPEVLVDFIFRQGVFYVAVANVGGAPAHDVSVKFDKPFHGLGGEREISSFTLFRRLPFLAPHKAIETILDSSSAYFARREPTRITAQITYRDTEKRAYERKIVHDLAVYKDIAYVVQPASGDPSSMAAPMVRTASSGIWEKKYGS
jgi:hypothetical protein